MRGFTRARQRRQGQDNPAINGNLLSRRRLLEAALGVMVAAGAGVGRRPRATAARPVAPGGRTGPAGSAQPVTDTVVVQWNNAALQAIRDTKPGPPMVARALAVLHTCIYDAWAMYDPVAVGTAISSDLRQPAAARTAANRRQAISVAAYRALVDLFPVQGPSFDRLLLELGYDPADGSTDPAAPAGIANRCAAAVLEFRHADGSNQLGDLNPGAYSDYTGYEPINTPDEIVDPDRWQPLRVPDGRGNTAVQQYIGPHWGLVTPFAMTSGDQFRPAEGPAAYGTERYQTQAAQILDYSANLTDRQKVITEYWADGPASELPPGHWCLFGQFVSRRDRHDLDTDVRMFFILSNAVLDAGIAAWDAKRVFDSVRPVTAVRFLNRGRMVRAWAGPFQGTRSILGEDWQLYQSPVVVTPAFPEFFSGHSTFSAAAAEVLQRFTGSDAFGASATIPQGSSLLEPGLVPAQDLTLAWETFSAAADEAGLSRRYGGIHFEQGDLSGRATGRLVGALVWDRAQAYITDAR